MVNMNNDSYKLLIILKPVHYSGIKGIKKAITEMSSLFLKWVVIIEKLEPRIDPL